jgi:hypothetical protein
MSVLSPFVFWAQNEKNIFIKVDLKDVKDPDITIEKRRLQFQSKGVGARGLNDYAFTIDFNSDIDVKVKLSLGSFSGCYYGKDNCRKAYIKSPTIE